MYFGIPETVVLLTETEGLPVAIDELTAIVGVKPSLPSEPSLPAEPVAPVGPVAPDGIPRESFFSVELQETVGFEFDGNGVAVTELIGELSTALQTT